MKIPRVGKALLVVILSGIPWLAPAQTQRVTVDVREADAQTVFTQIKEQTGLNFVYNADQLRSMPRITLRMENATVEAVLEQMFKGTAFEFRFEEGIVIVKRKTQEVKQSVTVSGLVTDKATLPLPGVTVQVMGTSAGTATNEKGRFSITLPMTKGKLRFSFVGYRSQEVEFSATTDSLRITLEEEATNIDEVVVVSTGYMRLPKERATGSFGVVTAKELEKRPSPNIVNRLEGIVPGVYVSLANSDMTFLYDTEYATGNQDEMNELSIGVRGNSGLSINSHPLIVVDGFVTEFELRDLNPNDIESITFLKDAAAASIWGARAANGVMVVETKKGNKGKASVSFGMNILVSGQPRFNTLPIMNSAQMIDFERELVDGNYLNRPTVSNYSGGDPVTQVAELLFDMKDGTVSEEDGEAMLAELASREAYADVKKYLLQASSSQSYNLSFSGGTDYMTYFLSASYAREKSNTVGNNGERFTFTNNLSFKLLNWATLRTSIKATLFNLNYSDLGLSVIQPSVGGLPLMPYDRLVDDEGNHVKYAKDYYEDFLAQREEMGYLDWHYDYLDELENMDKSRQEQDISLNVGLNIPIPGVKGLSFDGSFMYELSNVRVREHYNEESYYARNTYNYGTYYDSSDGTLEHNIADGGILRLRTGKERNFNIRWQANYDNTIADIHQIAVLAGIELRETRSWSNSVNYYGYDENTLLGDSSVENPYQNVFGGTSSTLQNGSAETDYRRHYLSYYGNMSYTLMHKYVLSGSVRYDDYNNFGLDRKYRATPLWSTGLAWHIGEEEFIRNIEWISRLTFRLTFGYNGNISSGGNPFTTITLQGADTFTEETTANISSAANPAIRWEKTGQLNYGLDFSLLNGRLSGSIEWYNKYCRDLFATYYINPIFGANDSQGYALSRNGAKMNGKGLDLSLGGDPIKSNSFTWNTRLNFSYNTDKVISSPYGLSDTFWAYGAGSGTSIEGYSVGNYWAYRWAGLDEEGYSQIYNAAGDIISYDEDITNDDLVYVGTTTPRYYGGFFNTFTYKKLSLYVGITYKFDYIFRKPSLSQLVIGNWGAINYDISEDIAYRWREPGDEETTNVPRLGSVATFDSFYRYLGADIHILDGDHIRLREVSLSYELPSKWLNKLRINSGSLGFTVTNLGLIWKKNNQGIDPDFVPNSTNLKMAPTPSYNFSLNLNL